MFSFLPSWVLRFKAGLVTEVGWIFDEEILGGTWSFEIEGGGGGGVGVFEAGENSGGVKGGGGGGGGSFLLIEEDGWGGGREVEVEDDPEATGLEPEALDLEWEWMSIWPGSANNPLYSSLTSKTLSSMSWINCFQSGKCESKVLNLEFIFIVNT